MKSTSNINWANDNLKDALDWLKQEKEDLKEKPSERGRYVAVAITELEKLIAWVFCFLMKE